MSETTTVKKAFENTVKTTVDSFVSTCSKQLSEWVKEHKDFDLSPEEICAALDVPFKPVHTPSMAGGNIMTQMPNLPNYYAGTGASPKKIGGGRRKKVVDPNLPICIYEKTRGTKGETTTKGTRCPKPVLGDSSVLGGMEYCKLCLVKKGVQKKLQGPKTTSTVQPPVLPNSEIEIPEQVNEKKGTLDAIEISGRPGFCREIRYGFIIEQTIDGNVVTSSIDDNGTERDLQPNEKAIAESLGIKVTSRENLLPVPVESTENIGVVIPN